MSERAGDWLKRRRIAAGYRKQESLTRQLGITRGAIGNWESGRGGPSPATVPALAAAVNVTQAEVIEAFGIQMHGALETPAPQDLIRHHRPDGLRQCHPEFLPSSVACPSVRYRAAAAGHVDNSCASRRWRLAPLWWILVR